MLSYVLGLEHISMSYMKGLLSFVLRLEHILRVVHKLVHTYVQDSKSLLLFKTLSFFQTCSQVSTYQLPSLNIIHNINSRILETQTQPLTSLGLSVVPKVFVECRAINILLCH